MAQQGENRSLRHPPGALREPGDQGEVPAGSSQKQEHLDGKQDQQKNILDPTGIKECEHQRHIRGQHHKRQDAPYQFKHDPPLQVALIGPPEFLCGMPPLTPDRFCHSIVECRAGDTNSHHRNAAQHPQDTQHHKVNDLVHKAHKRVLRIKQRFQHCTHLTSCSL